MRKIWWFGALSISANLVLVSLTLLFRTEQDSCEVTHRKTNVYLQKLLASTLARGHDPREVSVQIAETIVKWTNDSTYRSLQRTLARCRFTRAVGWEESCVDGTDLAAWWLLEEHPGSYTFVTFTEGKVTKQRAPNALGARFPELWLIGQSIVRQRGFESDDFLEDGVCSAVITVDHNLIETHFTYGIVPVSADSSEFANLRQLRSAFVEDADKVERISGTETRD